MDSFLSGYSNNLSMPNRESVQRQPSGTQGTGNASGGSNQQSADVTQLKEGDSFKGEIVSVNGEDVQILLTNGQYMAARLERDVQVAIGQVLNLQVKSNKDNKIVLKPVPDGNVQMQRVGAAALKAANLAINERNLQLVAKLIENGMSINKNTLMTFNRLALQHPAESLDNIIKLVKLQLPVTDANLSQYENYQNLEHRLLDGIKDASEEIMKLYDALANGESGTAAYEGANGAISAGVENAGKYMEQIINLLTEDGEAQTVQDAQMSGDVAAAGKEQAEDGQLTGSETAKANQAAGEGQVLDGQLGDKSVSVNEPLQGAVKGGQVQQNAAAANNEIMPGKDKINDGYGAQASDSDSIDGKTDSLTQNIRPNEDGTGHKASMPLTETEVRQLGGLNGKEISDKIINYMKEGRIDLKDIKSFLSDSSISKNLTSQIKNDIFSSESFRALVKNGLQRQWTIAPNELVEDGKVQEFYEKLARQSGKLAQLMNEAAAGGDGSEAGAFQSKAAANIHENVEFMNQMNQLYTYVQLPLKFTNSQAHGDLYVYTNKKNLARRDGMLTAFLHLDMENLGGIDVSIALQTEKNEVLTKFYLPEDSMGLMEEHIGELVQRLAKKGYNCKHMIQPRDEDKTVIEHIEEQAGGGAVSLSYQTFDMRT